MSVRLYEVGGLEELVKKCLRHSVVSGNDLEGWDYGFQSRACLKLKITSADSVDDVGLGQEGVGDRAIPFNTCLGKKAQRPPVYPIVLVWTL